MKNDILLFAVMFAVAWIGFGALKGHLQLPNSDDATPAASSLEDGNLIADPTSDDAANPSKTPTVRQASAELENTESADDISSKSNQASAESKAKTDNEKQSVSKSDEDLSTEEKIEQVLIDQTKAWNRGDLDGFMDAYWNDEKLTFSGGGDTTVGFEETYTNYRERFPEGKMGQIEFKDLQTEMVGEESAIVTGRFEHALPDDDVRGNFSLVLKSFDGQWKIIHDHTSVAK